MKIGILPTVQTDDLIALTGRLLLSAIFLASAFGKITNFAGTTQYMEAHGMFWTPFFCALAIAVEALGGVALVLGFHARWGAGALAAYVLAATVIFHTSGGVEAKIHVLKNLAVIGGLLQVMAFGPGPMSLEGRRA